MEHREIFAVPTTDPGAGPTKLHLYACRKRATASVRVSGAPSATAETGCPLPGVSGPAICAARTQSALNWCHRDCADSRTPLLLHPLSRPLLSGHLVMPASHEAWDASSGRCSFGATGKAMFFQELFECLTCGLEAVCASCARKCHAGHDTKVRGPLTGQPGGGCQSSAATGGWWSLLRQRMGLARGERDKLTLLMVGNMRWKAC